MQGEYRNADTEECLHKPSLLMSWKAHAIFFFKVQKVIHAKWAGVKAIAGCSPRRGCTFSNVALRRHQPHYLPKGTQGCLKPLLLWHPRWVLKDRIADNVKKTNAYISFNLRISPGGTHCSPASHPCHLVSVKSCCLPWRCHRSWSVGFSCSHLVDHNAFTVLEDFILSCPAVCFLSIVKRKIIIVKTQHF